VTTCYRIVTFENQNEFPMCLTIDLSLDSSFTPTKLSHPVQFSGVMTLVSMIRSKRATSFSVA